MKAASIEDFELRMREIERLLRATDSSIAEAMSRTEILRTAIEKLSCFLCKKKRRSAPVIPARNELGTARPAEQS
jgi:hypothetical protein